MKLQAPCPTVRPQTERGRRPLLDHGILIVVLAAAYGLTSLNPAFAADIAQPSIIHLGGEGQRLALDLTVLCPSGGFGVPQFQNKNTGKVFPISDPQLRAIAERACGQGVASLAQSTVDVVNDTGAPIYVGFTGSITWATANGCKASDGGTEAIAKGTTCEGTITVGGSTHFCANTTPGALDCSKTQMNHLTNIETTFTGGYVAYDISVIPLNPVQPGYGYCTDCTWNGNSNDPTCSPPPKNAKSYCAGTGKIAYNLPVMLSCSGEPTYKCQGPLSTKGPSGVTYGEEYPSHCGNPNATCACGSPGCAAANCVAAYYYPMFYPPDSGYQPNGTCPAGKTLVITFLPGQ